jgi:predicted metal-dependent RNase
VVLVHGEPRQRAALAAKVRERFGVEAGMPERLAVVEL